MAGLEKPDEGNQTGLPRILMRRLSQHGVINKILCHGNARYISPGYMDWTPDYVESFLPVGCAVG